MNPRLDKDLVIIIASSVLLAAIIALLPSNVLRIILGLPFILLFPGYTLIAALFPRQSDLDGIERLALSLGLSVAVVPLIGLILNYTTWGIRLYPILISLMIFIFVMSGIAWYRRHRFPPGERSGISFNFRLPSWEGHSRIDKVLSVMLAVAILGAIGSLIYVVTTPKEGEKFTEFYILGLEGKAELYPTEFVLDDGTVALVRYGGKDTYREKESDYGWVTLGIVNHEFAEASYKVNVWLDDNKMEVIGPILLTHETRWEQTVRIIPTQAGEDQKVYAPVFLRAGNLLGC